MAELAALWIENGTADTILQKKRREAEARNMLARQILDGFQLETRLTGFYCWLKLPDPWKAEIFTDTARQHGLIVADSRLFALSHDIPEQGVRLALGGTSERSRLQRSLELVASLLHSKTMQH